MNRNLPPDVARSLSRFVSEEQAQFNEELRSMFEGTEAHLEQKLTGLSRHQVEALLAHLEQAERRHTRAYYYGTLHPFELREHLVGQLGNAS